jgi:hypothetical protein
MDALVGRAFSDARDLLGAEAVAAARQLLSHRRACGGDKLCILDRQVEAIESYGRMGISVAVPEWVTSYRDALGDRLSKRSAGSLPMAVGRFLRLVRERWLSSFVHLGIRDRALPPGGRGANVLERDA